MGSASASAQSTSNVADGTWRFVATTYDGARLQTYVNTAKVADVAAKGNITASADALEIGADSAWGEHLNGAIDNVRIYPRALSASELAADRTTDAATDAAAAVPTPTPSPTPSPSPTPTPTPTPTGGNNCMAKPSACGFPDVSTTGVKPGVARTDVNGDVTLSTAGQVYENKTVHGSISVTAPNVTVRNVKVVMTRGAFYGIQAFDWSTNVSNLLLQDVEVDMNGTLGSSGIAYGNFTAQRVFIHNGSDCVSFTNNATVKDSMCVIGPDANSDGWPDSTSFCDGSEHFDGLQSDGGGGYTIDHNTIRNTCDQTSAIIMSTNSNPIHNVSITNNLMAGGGYTLYCNAGPDVPSEVVTGNRFAKTFWTRGGYWGPMTGCGMADTYRNNVWDDTGATLAAG
jgi:hypothetical protein